MTISFAHLCEVMDQQNAGKSPLMDSGIEDQAMQCIRAGLSLREEADGPSFWEDFISVCSNASNMAALLGVKEEAVSSWATKIREALDEVEKHDQQHGSEEEEEEMVPTGDNGAVTDQNMGPFGKVK